MSRFFLGKAKMGMILAAAGAALIATPLALGGLANQGYDFPTLPTAQRLMAMLDARSPGEREKGELSASKKAAKKIAEAGPRQRALGKITKPETKPSEEFVQALVGPKTTEAIVPPGPVTLADIVPVVSNAAAPPLGGIGGGGGGTSIIGGGGGGGGSGGGSGGGGSGGGGGGGGENVVPPPVAAVPEPGTWMMMLLGFGMVGAAVRRRRHGAGLDARAA